MKIIVRKTVTIILFLGGLVLAPLALIIAMGPLLFEQPIDTNPPRSQFSLTTLLPNVVGNGLAFADIDQDGDDDLFVTSYPTGTSSPSVLLRNEGGILKDATSALGLPSVWGSSAFFADIDNDSYPDLFLVEVVWGTDSHRRADTRIRYYKNVRGLSFIETPNVALNTTVGSTEGSLSFGDYDGDGDLDLVASYLGEGRKYLLIPRNDSFRRGTLLLGSAWIAAFCGDKAQSVIKEEPDLAHMLQADFGSADDFLKRGGCLYHPRDYAPGVLRFPAEDTRGIFILATTPGAVRIFHNNGGSFEEAPQPLLQDLSARGARIRGISGQMGWDVSSRRFFQPISADMNNDGRQDILVATDIGRNALLLNEGSWRFRDLADSSGLDIFGTGMGIAPGDPYHRGQIDYLITNFGHIFRFIPTAVSFALDEKLSLSHLGFGWGIAFTDMQNDGWDDVYIGNGTRTYAEEDGEDYREAIAHGLYGDTGEGSYAGAFARNRLYLNRTGRFVDVSGIMVPDITSSSRPIAVADIDGDGFEEIAVGGSGRPTGPGLSLLKNVGGENAFVKVKLQGTVSNRQGVGATIILKSGHENRARLVAVGESFSAQHSMIKSFGLGAYEGRDVMVEVRWPSGIVQSVTIPVGTTTTITESF